MKKRLLFVASRFPYPPIGGDRARVFNLLQQLARFYEVTLLVLGDPVKDDVHALKSNANLTTVELFSHTRFSALRGALRSLVTGEPLQVGYYRSHALALRLKVLSRSVDVVQFHLIRTSNLWDGEPQPLALLDMCDAISANFAQTAQSGSKTSLWHWISRLEAPRTRRFEQREIARFHRTTLVSHFDVAQIGTSSVPATVVTCGAALTTLPWTDRTANHDSTIALIGKMDYFPNWHGAVWFATHVLPMLPPEITLRIIGDCSPSRMRQLAALDRVTVTGRVETIAHACRGCFAGIAPMQVATGLQTKVLEYFALGLPSVISTSVSNGLLPESTGVTVVADTAAAWVAALQKLYVDKVHAFKISTGARAYVETHHDWERIGDAYHATIQANLDARAHHASGDLPSIYARHALR